MRLGAVLKETIAYPDRALSQSCDELTHNRQRLDSAHLSINLRAQVPCHSEYPASHRLASVESLRGTQILPICRDHFWGEKTACYVTGRPNILSPREVKNDVWRYLRNIVMGLYAVWQFVSKSLLTLTLYLAFLLSPPLSREYSPTQRYLSRCSSLARSLAMYHLGKYLADYFTHAIHVCLCPTNKKTGSEPGPSGYPACINSHGQGRECPAWRSLCHPQYHWCSQRGDRLLDLDSTEGTGLWQTGNGERWV